jgi:hypothetical protein
MLTRQKDIHTSPMPAISKNRTQSRITSSNRNTLGPEMAVQLPYRILEVTTKTFPKFNATGRSLLIKFNFSGEEQENLHISGNALLH